MIVIGYQGIGKSTLSKKSFKYVDLESGNFWVRNHRYSDWVQVYVNIATDLSKQGYVVFVSSHKAVREEISRRRTDQVVVVIYPTLELKDYWIGKLQERYDRTESEKDFKALMNALSMFDENITDLQNEDPGFVKIPIQSENYNLEDLIQDCNSH